MSTDRPRAINGLFVTERTFSTQREERKALFEVIGERKGTGLMVKPGELTESPGT